MKQISIDAHKAFMNNKKFNKDNTSVEIVENGVIMTLFGNTIAIKDKYGEISISAGGYKPTAATRDRLSAFVDIRLDKGSFILNETMKWDGKWISLKDIPDRRKK